MVLNQTACSVSCQPFFSTTTFTRLVMNLKKYASLALPHPPLSYHLVEQPSSSVPKKDTLKVVLTFISQAVKRLRRPRRKSPSDIAIQKSPATPYVFNTATTATLRASSPFTTHGMSHTHLDHPQNRNWNPVQLLHQAVQLQVDFVSSRVSQPSRAAISWPLDLSEKKQVVF